MKSSIKISRGQIDFGIIPFEIFNDGLCKTIPKSDVSRFALKSGGSNEICFSANIEDKGREIIFTNYTSIPAIPNASSIKIYSQPSGDGGLVVFSIPTKAWIRMRVMVDLGVPYLLVVQSGVITHLTVDE